jgi:hypothetical protein
LLACLVAAPLAFYESSEDYRDLHSRARAEREWDVYRGALKLQRSIGAVIVPRPGETKFWYDPTLPDHAALNSVQSMYLWGFSRITNMPAVGDAFRAAVGGTRYIVLLGLTRQEVDEGLAALSSAGIGHRVLLEDEAGGTSWSFRFAVAQLLTPDERDERGSARRGPSAQLVSSSM